MTFPEFRSEGVAHSVRGGKVECGKFRWSLFHAVKHGYPSGWLVGVTGKR